MENHLNMLVPLDDHPSVSFETLAFILNSDLVDTVFRCISGSVAVSAYELENLPLPGIDLARSLESMLREGNPRGKVLRELRSQYAA